MQQKIISAKSQGATEHKFSSISAQQFLRYSVHKILQTKIQTDRKFLKIVKPYSGYLKTWKPIKNRLSKLFLNPILSSYVYRRKQKRSSNTGNFTISIYYEIPDSYSSSSLFYKNLQCPFCIFKPLISGSNVTF